MTYELAKELKDAGLRWENYPTLSELIQVCGQEFAFLSAIRDESERIIAWHAGDWSQSDEDNCTDIECCPDATVGDTPEEAVARLWLALNKP